MKTRILSLLLLALSAAPAALRAQTVRPAAAADSAAVDTTGVQLGEATVRATRLVLVVKKDTLVYDMDALGAAKGDLLGDMIARMPGLELRDGALYLNGKAVSRILVNGTDFVRGDTKRALEALPAYMVKHVKAYESQSDMARVTGLDDGVREQVIDVLLKKEYKGFWAGNADLGYGTDDYWRLRGFLSTFTDDSRFSLGGGFTNTGEYQNASFEGDWSDNGAGASSGETTYMKPSLQGMWKNGKYEQGKAGFYKIEYGASWDYRGHNDYNRTESSTRLADGTNVYGANDSRRKDNEYLWNGNLYFTMQPFKWTYVEINPSFTYRMGDNRSHYREARWNTPVYERYASPLDSVFARPDEGWPQGEAIHSMRGETMSDNDSYFYNQWIWATQRLTEKNMRLSLRSSTRYHYSRGEDHDLSVYRYFTASGQTPDPLYNRYTHNHNHSFFTQNFLDLNIPVPQLQSLRLTYGFEKSRERGVDAGYRLERAGGIFADPDAYLDEFGRLPTADDWRTLCRDADISLYSVSRERKHWAEADLSYKKEGIYAQLKNTARFERAEMDYVKDGYDPILLSRDKMSYNLDAVAEYKTDSVGKFRLAYALGISPHELRQEITIPDLSDPLQVRLGNSRLRPLRNHNVNFNYDLTLKDGRLFAFGGQWYARVNQSQDARTYDKLTGVTVSQPRNISGSWQTSFWSNYTQPLDAEQKMTLTFNLSYTYSHSPFFETAVEGRPVRCVSLRHRPAGSVRFNLRRDKLFASAFVRASYSSRRTVSGTPSSDHYWMNWYSAMVQYTLPWDVELRTTVNVRHNTVGTAASYKPVRTIWNARISKSLLRSKALAVQVEGSDLLNQRAQQWAWSDAGGSTSGESMTVGRFVMFHLVYRFSTKTK